MVLVVEPMKEPYLKEIDLGLHSLQAEVGGDIAASYPFSDPVGLVCNDEGKLIGLELNRGLRDEDGNLYDIMAGTFLVVGLGEEDFTSLPPELAQKYMEHFKQPEQFINLNGQIIALPVEPENPLRTAEMTVEDDYGMIDGVINNGRKGEELEAAKGEVRRTSPEKKPSIRERLEAAKRSAANASPRTKPTRRSPRSTTYEPEQEVAAGMGFLPGGERPPQVQQGLQGLRPPLQAELPGCPHRLSPLPVRTLKKVRR